jgi:prepilin-type N-terminal cleavage/methylation domain-containing protein
MRPKDTSGFDRWEHALPVEWHDCSWQPSIELNRPTDAPPAAITKPLPMPAFLPHPARRKNSFKLMKKNPASPRHFGGGFTLVELLTVIAIIAILAAMLLPVLSRVKLSALKTKARIEANDIATAIQAYDSAYGRFPVSAQAQNQASQNAQNNLNPDFTYGGTFSDTNGATYIVQTPGLFLTNSEVIAILMNYTNYPNGSGSTINTNYQKNPQKTIFLNAKLTGDTTSDGVGTDLVYRDPWGNPYIITLDLNYDEQCQDAFYDLQAVSQQNGQSGYNGLVNSTDSGGNGNNFRFHGKVMVWSAGPPVSGKTVVAPGLPANSAANKNHILTWQ